MDSSTRLIDLTVNDLIQLITECVKQEVKNINQEKEEDEIVFGTKALAEILGCSERQAIYIKSAGIYAEAITMEGHRTITNKTLLRKLIWEKNKPKHPHTKKSVVA